jgi:hypothetical protein
MRWPLPLIWLILAGFCRVPGPVSAAGTYTSPIIAAGADPWVTFHEGYDYLTYTTGSSVVIHRATSLAGTNGLGQAPYGLVSKSGATARRWPCQEFAALRYCS